VIAITIRPSIKYRNDVCKHGNDYYNIAISEYPIWCPDGNWNIQRNLPLGLPRIRHTDSF
jgi:hypothetical protein